MKSLTLMDICPVDYPDKGFIFTAIDFLVESLEYLPSITSKADLQQKMGQRFDNPKFVAFLLSNLQHVDQCDQFQWKFGVEQIHAHRMSIAKFDTLASQRMYHGPLLIVKAQHGDFVKVKYLERVSRMFSNYRVTTVANAGHGLHTERPDETAEKVNKWIRHVEAQQCEA